MQPCGRRGGRDRWLVERLRLVGRADALRILEAADDPLAAGVCELDDVLAVVLVNALAELAPEGHASITIDRGVVGDDVAAAVDDAGYELAR